MAKYRPPQPAVQRIQFAGMEDMESIYADVFLLSSEGETGMCEIYFFQSQVAIPNLGAGTMHVGPRNKANCVARLILSNKGVETLFQALAENRGITIKPEGEDKESKREGNE